MRTQKLKAALFFLFFSLGKINVVLLIFSGKTSIAFHYKLSKRRFVMILRNRWHCILCALDVKGHVRWALLESNSHKIDSHGTQYPKDHVDHLRLLWSKRKQKSWTFGLLQGEVWPNSIHFPFSSSSSPWVQWWPRSASPVAITLLPSLTQTQLTDARHRTQGCATWLTECFMCNFSQLLLVFWFLWFILMSHIHHSYKI